LILNYLQELDEDFAAIPSLTPPGVLHCAALLMEVKLLHFCNTADTTAAAKAVAAEVEAAATNRQQQQARPALPVHVLLACKLLLAVRLENVKQLSVAVCT
jgi:hypothetical protein